MRRRLEPDSAGIPKSFLGNVGSALPISSLRALKDECRTSRAFLRPAGHDLVLTDDGVLRLSRAQKHDHSDDCEREWVSAFMRDLD